MASFKFLNMFLNKHKEGEDMTLKEVLKLKEDREEKKLRQLNHIKDL